MNAAARFRVTGHVQGVFFRASTRTEAVRLGLRGHARNREDGSVDVLAVGEGAAIDELAAWLRMGPPHARVDELERLPAQPDEAGAGFDIG